MSVFLLDTNVLISLAWRNHAYHVVAFDWFSKLGAHQWATCPMTQAGFVRISSNIRFISEALAPREALALLDKVTSQPGHIFWQDNVSLSDASHFPRENIRGHQQITDAYLLALCRKNGGNLVTFDAGIPSLRSAAEVQIITLLPVA